MGGTRTFIENAVRIEDTLSKARRCKDCRDALQILEALLADPDLKKFLSQPSTQKTKIIKAYQNLMETFATELYQISLYIAGQLNELDNVKIDDACPASHTNASIAFNNLSHYLVNDILSAPNAAIRVFTLKRWFNIMEISMKRGDFHSAAAIHAGLNDAALSRLKTMFIHLDAEETALMDRMNDIFLRDQGWKLMNERLESSDQSYFIPSLAGIKKAATKAKEARQTHSMHSAFLESQGKLTRSSTLSAAADATNPSRTPPTKKTPFELLTALIAELKRSNRLNSTQQLTRLQRDIISSSPAQQDISIKPIRHDEHICYTTSSSLEREEIPNTLRQLQEQLYRTVSFLAGQKKLPEPLKTLKKKLHGFQLDEIVNTSFGATERCASLKKILADLDAQTSMPKTPGLLRTSTQSRLSNPETHLPELASILRIVNQIDEFTKRNIRMTQESSTSSASLPGSSPSDAINTATTASSASTITSLSTYSQATESNATDQPSTGTDREFSSPSLASSMTQLSQFSFTLIPPVKVDAADIPTVSAHPLKETKSLHQRDAASEKGFLSRHGSMTSKNDSLNLSDTPQRSPQGSPSTATSKK